MSDEEQQLDLTPAQQQAPETTEQTALTVPDAGQVGAWWTTEKGFALLQRQARLLSESKLVPKEYQRNLPDCVIALSMAYRMNADPMAVMQNLYIVHGKPSWSSQFIIAAVNSCGRFNPLQFELWGEGDDFSCMAWATAKVSKERYEGPPVSIGMAKDEGWFGKNGSKWKTMPELMLRYRAATLFGRLYAPEILMGIKTYEEVIDIGAEAVKQTETLKLEV